MNPTALSDIPFQVDPVSLLASLHLTPDSEEAAPIHRLVEQAQQIGRPKALYGLAFIEQADDTSVTIDGVTFKSRVLRVNLDKTHRVFPYIATCGMELEEWAGTISDPLERYCAETIKQRVLGAALAELSRHLDAAYNPGATAIMNPGSLSDWPLGEQRKLFALCGDPKACIGVTLSASYLMVPTKSVSGIRFATEEHYENCQLCPRLDCPGRRVPYDESLMDRKYKQEVIVT